MMEDKGVYFFKRFRIAFHGVWISRLVVIMAGALTVKNPELETVLVPVVFIFVWPALFLPLMYYWYLSRLTVLLKKSQILWLGGVFLTSIIGYLIAYFRMRNFVVEKGWTHLKPW